MKLRIALGAFNALVVVFGLIAGGMSWFNLLACTPWVLAAAYFLARPTRGFWLAAALANGCMLLAGGFFTLMAIRNEMPEALSLALGCMLLPGLNLLALLSALQRSRSAASVAA